MLVLFYYNVFQVYVALYAMREPHDFFYVGTYREVNYTHDHDHRLLVAAFFLFIPLFCDFIIMIHFYRSNAAVSWLLRFYWKRAIFYSKKQTHDVSISIAIRSLYVAVAK